MSETVDWGWVRHKLLEVQAEQRMLRAMVEPMPARLSALEARFSALEARFGGIEDGINGIGLALRHQEETLAGLVQAISGGKAV